LAGAVGGGGGGRAHPLAPPPPPPPPAGRHQPANCGACPGRLPPPPPHTTRPRLQDAINQQNAAFALGVIAHSQPAAAGSWLQQLLGGLAPLFQPAAAAGARDNAAGAVARLVLAFKGALPLEQVVPTWLSALPLQV